MKNKKEDWPNKILKFLYKKYTPFNVPLNTFLTKKLRIGLSDGNKGRKLNTLLHDLAVRGLIHYETTDYHNKEVQINANKNDLETVKLEKYLFHAKLQIEGYNYISNLISIERQEKFRWLSWGSSAIATIFIILTTIYTCSDNTDKELNKINESINNLNQNLKQYLNINTAVITTVDTIKKNDNTIDSLNYQTLMY